MPLLRTNGTYIRCAEPIHSLQPPSAPPAILTALSVRYSAGDERISGIGRLNLESGDERTAAVGRLKCVALVLSQLMQW